MRKFCSIPIIIFLVLLAGLFGWGSMMRSIENKIIERARTETFAADLTQSELETESITFDGFIQLPASKVVHLNDEIRLYAKIHSHHNGYVYGGYIFLNVNGKVYRSSGPCRDWVTDLPLPAKPIENLKESELVELLLDKGFHKIESNNKLN